MQTCTAPVSYTHLDVYKRQGSTELSLTIATGGLFVVDPENAGFVSVKCQRLTVALEIAPGGFKIGESRLGINKQATGGDGQTQFGRAMNELNITGICANTSSCLLYTSRCV